MTSPDRPPLPSAQGRPLVIAHRGASAYRPENTLSAYELAVEQGADMIEIDLHTTRDGVVAIRHDAELEPLGRDGEIADCTLAELRELDVGGGQSIPTLDEVLDAFGSRIPFNLELKIGEAGGRYPGMEAAAVEAARRRGILDRTLYSSFYDEVLRELRAIGGTRVRLAVLVSLRHPERVFERAEAVGAEAVNPFFTLVDAELVARCHGEGLAVYPYTVDEPDWMERLLDLGVDGLFTNRPDRMRSLLKEQA
jgi:glycerophosphoryl diester phosphodiesterase